MYSRQAGSAKLFLPFEYINERLGSSMYLEDTRGNWVSQANIQISKI